MAKQRFSGLNTKNIVETVLRYALPIMFTLAILVMIYFSFIDNISMPGNWRSVTLFGLSGGALSYMIWVTSYKKQYENILDEDLNNEVYSIHRRYYFARRGWKIEELQMKLEIAKHNFVEAWIKDIEEITGRKREDIIKQGYKGFAHKVLIYRLKHNLFPKFGVRYARELLQVLNVAYSPNQPIAIHAAEKHYRWHATTKLIFTILILCTTGSILIEFLTGSILTALFRLAVAIISLVTSLVMGSVNGYVGAQKKLGVAEMVSENLEEWKGMVVTEEPFKEVKRKVIEEPKVEQLSMEEIFKTEPIPQAPVQLFPRS